jgi:hypothetical protein
VDLSWAAAIVLAGFVVLRWILLGLGAALLIRPVRDCPACFGPTFALQRPRLQRLAPWLEWRFCPRCRWQGPGRRVQEPSAGPQSMHPPPPVRGGPSS